MPVIRIGNYNVPSSYRMNHGYEEGAKEWRASVRLALWRAIREMGVPGLEMRCSVTFVFDPEWEPCEAEAADPRIAYVFIEGFEDRKDRPVEMRETMARAIGQALVGMLEPDWSVEVMPKRYRSEHEGAVTVRHDTKP